MDFYDFIINCRDEGLTPDEALDEWSRICAERKARFEEEYWSDPAVCEGWAQQDVIDMYRRER